MKNKIIHYEQFFINQAFAAYWNLREKKNHFKM